MKEHFKVMIKKNAACLSNWVYVLMEKLYILLCVVLYIDLQTRQSCLVQAAKLYLND